MRRLATTILSLAGSLAVTKLRHVAEARFRPKRQTFDVFCTARTLQETLKLNITVCFFLFREGLLYTFYTSYTYIPLLSEIFLDLCSLCMHMLLSLIDARHYLSALRLGSRQVPSFPMSP